MTNLNVILNVFLLTCHLVKPLNKSEGEYPLYGKPAEITDAPYTAAIYVLEFYECIGSYIKEHWVLTSGCCIATKIPKDIIVVMGTNKINEVKQRRNATKLEIHPEYIAVPLKNDVGLIRVETPFTMEKSIKIIPINAKPLNFNQPCSLVGWGLGVNRSNEEFYDIESIILRKVEIKLIEAEKCKKSLKEEVKRYGQGLVDENVFCAVGSDGEVCIKDLGAALVCKGKQVGIASMITRECGKGAPSLYTNLSKFKSWIDGHMILSVRSINGSHKENSLIVIDIIVLMILLIL